MIAVSSLCRKRSCQQCNLTNLKQDHCGKYNLFLSWVQLKILVSWKIYCNQSTIVTFSRSIRSFTENVLNTTFLQVGAQVTAGIVVKADLQLFRNMLYVSSHKVTLTPPPSHRNICNICLKLDIYGVTPFTTEDVFTKNNK